MHGWFMFVLICKRLCAVGCLSSALLCAPSSAWSSLIDPWALGLDAVSTSRRSPGWKDSPEHTRRRFAVVDGSVESESDASTVSTFSHSRSSPASLVERRRRTCCSAPTCVPGTEIYPAYSAERAVAVGCTFSTAAARLGFFADGGSVGNAGAFENSFSRISLFCAMRSALWT